MPAGASSRILRWPSGQIRHTGIDQAAARSFPQPVSGPVENTPVGFDVGNRSKTRANRTETDHGEKVQTMVKGDATTVRARRLTLGLTVKALAELAGVDRSRVTHVEEGEPVRPATLGAILAALDAAEHDAGLSDYPPDAAPPEGPLRVAFEAHGINVTVEGIDQATVQAVALKIAYGMLAENDRHNRKEKTPPVPEDGGEQ